MFLTEAWGSLLTTSNIGRPRARARAASPGNCLRDGSGVNDGVGGGGAGVRESPSLLPEELGENESWWNSGKGGKSSRMDPAGFESESDVDRAVPPDDSDGFCSLLCSCCCCSLSFPCSGVVSRGGCGFAVSETAWPLGRIGLSMASAACASACAFVAAPFLIASGVALTAPFLLFASNWAAPGGLVPLTCELSLGCGS